MAEVMDDAPGVPEDRLPAEYSGLSARFAALRDAGGLRRDGVLKFYEDGDVRFFPAFDIPVSRRLLAAVRLAAWLLVLAIGIACLTTRPAPFPPALAWGIIVLAGVLAVSSLFAFISPELRRPPPLGEGIFVTPHGLLLRSSQERFRFLPTHCLRAVCFTTYNDSQRLCVEYVGGTGDHQSMLLPVTVGSELLQNVLLRWLSERRGSET